jgi:N-methylhydantoinase B
VTAFLDILGEAVETASARIPSETLRARLLDPAVALVDPSGRVVACSPPAHFGTLGEAARAVHVASALTLADGDVVVLNDPFTGGTRVQDLFAVHLVELSPRLGLWAVVARTTVGDLGGDVFGSYNPNANELWAEGARITPIRIGRKSGGVRDTFTCVVLNSRVPRLLQRQLEGAVAALGQAAARLREAGADLAAESARLLALEAGRTRAVLADVRPEPVEVRVGESRTGPVVRLRPYRHDGRVVLDFSSSDPNVAHYVNTTRGTTVGASLRALSAQNDGALEVVEVRTRPGTIVDVSYPLPSALGAYTTAAATRQAVRQALLLEPEPAQVAAPPVVGADGVLAEEIAVRLKEDEARLDKLPFEGEP